MSVIMEIKLNDQDKKDLLFLIDKSRIKLMQTKLSFYGHILLQLKHDYDGHKIGVPTIGVSCDTIYYNLNYLHANIKSCEDMIFVYLHEIMHIVLDHLDLNRIGKRNMMLWNKAGDHVINLDLYANGYKYSGEKHILKDNRFKGMTTEKVYDVLLDEEKKKGNFDENGNPIPGKGMDAENWQDIIATATPESLEKLKEMIVNSYNNHVLTHGNSDGVPQCIRDAIEKIEKQVLPWNMLLRKYICEASYDDFSWNKLNKNFFPKFYIPALYSESLAKIDFAIDVSGSINKQTFDIFINEIKNILLMNNITSIGIYQFDTRTLSYDIVSNLNELNEIKFHGGGGTCIKDTLMQASRTDAKAMFIITDGYMDLNLVPLNKPTVWCVYDNPNFKEPFGSTILFDDYI